MCAPWLGSHRSWVKGPTSYGEYKGAGKCVKPKYYIPPGLIASGYVLSLGAGSHPGCLASKEIPFEPLPG